MSKHAWIQENLAAYIAGGLDAEEAERLETHVASCPNCAQSLDKARDADRALTALFAGVMPDAGLEDRVIQRLRNVQPSRFPHVKRYMRFAAAAAAILLVGLVGTMINQAVDKRVLNIPGDEFAFYLGSPESLKARLHDSLSDITIAGYTFEGRSLLGEGTKVTEASSPETSQDWSKYRAVDKFIGGVEVKAKDGESKAAAAPGDDTLAEDPVVPLPVGHDRMDKGGFYVGGEFTYLKNGQSVKGVTDQVTATRGILDHDGSITADLNGIPQSRSGGKPATGNPAPGTFHGSGTAALNANQGSSASATQTGQSVPYSYLNNFNSKNLVSGLTPQGVLTEEFGVEISGMKAPSNGKSSADVSSTPGLQNSLGYYPPVTALGVPKAEPRLHTNLGRDTSSTGVNGSASSSLSPLPTGGVAGTRFTTQKQLQTGRLIGENSKGSAAGQVSDHLVTYQGRELASSNGSIQVFKDWNPASNKVPESFKPNDIKLGEQEGLGRSLALSAAQNKVRDDYGVDRANKDGKETKTGKSITQSTDGGTASKEVSLRYIKAKAGDQDPQAEGQTPSKTQPPVAQATPRKVIIRTGEVEFEVESFDAATAIINRLVNAIPGGFVATTNSEKLPNGKVRGSVVVRTPPEHLDELVIALRRELGKTGELKGQRIGSQDITKQFTDLESRLRAARTMEERLLQIIKTGKGEVKDLLNVEKELGVWRTKIEEMEGELRYFAHQVALSTLTVTLAEKEIKAPYGMLETERINMGIETEDVEKAQAQTFTIVADVKGRITKSELKQLDAGQFNAVINFEVPPDAAGPVRDRLKQLGNLARFDVNRVMEAEGGTGKPQDGKVTRKDAQFFLSLYNLANVAPREVTNFDLATPDAEAAYKALLTRVQKLGGRIVTSNLNRQNNDQTVGTISFQVKAAEADALIAELKAIGETLRHQTTESPDVGNTTKSKRGFLVQIMAWGAVPARETTALQLATPDVPASYRKLQETIATAKGRMLSAQLNEQNRQNTTGILDFEVRRPEESVIRATLASLGDVLSRNVTRVPENDSAISSKVHLQVALFDAARIPPRETTALEIEPTDVDATATLFTSIVREAGGRTVESHVSRERNGKATSKLSFNVPLAAAPEVVERFKSSGIVRVQDKSRNPQVPDGPLAVARIEVTLSNSELIVPSDQGLWPQVRKGLSTSFVGLSWSLTVVIIGILFVLPWVLAIYAGYRMVRWMRGARVTG